jgi:6-phosphogluconolactonase
VVNELDSTVTVFGHTEGVLEHRQTLSALPGDFNGESWCGEIRITQSGRFVYASNRGHDSIAIFACDPEDGLLTPLGHEPTQGRTPRDFALTPDGAYLLAANQDSDTVVVFAVNGENGLLRPTGQVIDVPNPASLVMMGL